MPGSMPCKTQESLHPPSHSVIGGYNEKLAIYKPGRRPSPRTQPCWHSDLGLLDSRTARSKVLLSIPNYDTSVITAQAD